MSKLNSLLNTFRRSRLPLLFGMGILIILLVSALTFQTPSSLNAPDDAPTSRNKHQWPFSAESIWNHPIGDQAQYVPAGIKAAEHIGPDVDYYIVTTEQDPLVPWHNPGNWGPGRCQPGQGLNGTLRVPELLVVPDSTDLETPNNASAFLQPDGQTLIQLNPLARCQPGGPVFGYPAPGHPDTLENIYGSGITGGHGGSGLSSIGGTIRQGELLQNTPRIRHALKLNLYAHRYLYQQPPGYRWPASRADRYAFDPQDPARYGGTNPALVMGALLAIAPNLSEQNLGLKTVPGKKIFHALQDYGGYIADDTAWNAHAIAIDQNVGAEFKSAYGYSLFVDEGNFFNDINRIFQALSIIDNNSPEKVGGGGTPRQPLAPPIAN